MRNILAIVGRDIRSGMRDWLIVWLTLFPFLIALVLRILIPGAGDMTLNIVTLADDPLAGLLEPYATVETVPDWSALEERVLRMDDVIGVVQQDGITEMVLQGNEMEGSEEMLSYLLERLTRQTDEIPALVSFSDVGWPMSPLKLYGGTLLFLFTTVFGGMFIVLNLVDEKMHDTLKALNVSPASRLQVVIGKSLLGFVLPVIGSFGAALILGFEGINPGMFVLSILSIALISVTMGFGIGVNNDDPIAAVASMKMIFMPVLISMFGAMYLADSWQWVLYWSPYYWAYQSIHSILLEEAVWRGILTNTGLIILITALVFAGLHKKIQNGFN